MKENLKGLKSQDLMKENLTRLSKKENYVYRNV